MRMFREKKKEKSQKAKVKSSELGKVGVKSLIENYRLIVTSPVRTIFW
jgi:hypothetical protein